MSKNSTLFRPGARMIGLYYFQAPHNRTVSQQGTTGMARLIVMLGGLYQARCADQTINAKAGDVVYWRANQEREEENDPAKPTRCITIQFTWPHAPVHAPGLIHDAAGVIRLLAARLLSLKQDPVPPPEPVWNAYLDVILAEYLRQAEHRQLRLLTRVSQYVDEHMAEPIPLANLARFVGLERHHFGRQFRKETGTPPMQYVRRRRVEHALGMLATLPEHWTIRRIAPRVGIPDEAQLRRLIVRFTGLGVRELKRLAAAKEPIPFLRRVT